MTTEKNEDERKSALPACVCVMDARAKNAANKVLYSAGEIIASDKILELVRKAYIRSKVYKNYRKDFIAIKVDHAATADKISLAVENLDKQLIAKGITIRRLGVNVVYRIARIDKG
jgi:hypothetical protein